MIHIIIDLEMNIIKKQTNERGNLSFEVIEIGAVKTDENYNIIDKFQTYVAPSFGPLDRKIIKLTHITDDKLIGACDYKKALEMFFEFVGEDTDVTYYSWSLSDIRQLIAESNFKDIYYDKVKALSTHWVDFQKEFSNLLGIDKIIKLKDAVSSADYTFTGAEHTALADAVNTAEIFILSKNPDKFEKVMGPVLDLFREKRKGSTLFDLCPDYFKKFKENNND